MPMDLSLVVPTLNEAQGIVAFLDEVLAVTAGLGSVEVIVVDDASEDGTADLARDRLGSKGRVIERSGPRSLALSVVDGWRAAKGAVLGLMDADLSHPPELIPAMLAEIEERGADVAVATRYVAGGGTEGWPWRRRLVSRVASGMARTLVHARDPLSGFVFMRREVIEGIELDPVGWKITLEVLVRGRFDRVGEVPFVFRDRAYGESKLHSGIMIDYIRHLARLRLHLLSKGRLRR